MYSNGASQPRQMFDLDKLKFGAGNNGGTQMPGGPPPPQPKPKKVQPLQKQVGSKISAIGTKLGELVNLESRLKQPELGLFFGFNSMGTLNVPTNWPWV